MTSLALAWRDLKGGLGGLGLLIICLVISVAGLASVLSLVAGMEKAIDDNARGLLGGDIKVERAMRPASEAELAALEAAGAVSATVETRAMLVADGMPSLVELKAIDDEFPLAGDLVLDGNRPAGNDVVIERELAGSLGLGLGDTLRIGVADFTVGGIADNVPGSGGFSFAPSVLVTPSQIAATGVVTEGSMVEYEYRVALPDPAADTEPAATAFEEQFPEGGWDIDRREEAGGGTARFVASTGDMLLLIALAAAGIGALGLASAARAFASSREKTVARLKLLGAQSRSLAMMLFLELGLIAFVSILAGLLLGALAPFAVSSQVSDLPIDPDLGPHWGALTQAGAIGALATLAAAYGPVARAISTRPAAVLRDDPPSGRRRWVVPLLAAVAAVTVAVLAASRPFLAGVVIGAMFASALLFALLGWVIVKLSGRMKHVGGPVTRLGIAALSRPGNATVRLSIALGLGLTLLVTLGGLGQSLLAQLDEAIPARAPALFLLDIPADEERNFRALVDDELPGATVEAVPSLRGSVTAVNGVPVSEMDIPDGAWILRGDRGLTFLKDLPESNEISAGEWWPADYDGPPLISLEQDSADALGLKIGDTMTLDILGRATEARIASLRVVNWQSFGFNFGIVFSPGSFDGAPYTVMATVGSDGPLDTENFERRMVEVLPMASIVNTGNIVVEVRRILEALRAAIQVATGFAILIGMIVLAGSVVATRSARARDMVLLRLIGGVKRQLVAAQGIEFLVLSGISVLVAFVAGNAAAWAACRYQFDIAYMPGIGNLLVLPLAAIALAVGAAMVAAWPALNASPARALRAR